MKKEYDWNAFNKARKNNPPRDTLVFALKKFSEENRTGLDAFDIGCGPGNDTNELLSNGWKVTATDSNPDVLSYLAPMLKKHKSKLEIQITPFEDIIWKKTSLVNASYTLPFCSKENFKILWNNIVSNIKVHGRFSGQFFGMNDKWTDLNRHSRKEVLKLFSGFEFEFFGEVEKDDKTSTGELKHWHIFNIVARKK